MTKKGSDMALSKKPSLREKEREELREGERAGKCVRNVKNKKACWSDIP